MALQVYHHRNGLPRLLKALEKGNVTLGFIGGSITDSRPGTRWPEYVIGWFVERYPDVRFTVENAAIGATGSDLAVFRAERDLIKRNCDIVFVEYAVNDYDVPTERRSRSREGLIRKLLEEERDIILTYTYIQSMYEDMVNSKVPSSIGEFEALAEHYGIGSVWMGLHAFEEVKRGRMKWEEWVPDGLHPEYRGSLSYAQSVIGFLEEELINKPNYEGVKGGSKLPAALNSRNWQNACLLSFDDIKLSGPWSIRRWAHYEWVEKILFTSAVGAKMSFEFEGTGLCLSFDFGKTSSEFRYRLDEGEWTEVKRDRPFWVSEMGWLRTEVITEDLKNGRHSMEIEVIHGNREECMGTNFRLAFVGILR